jgi:hypothetical protein
MQSINDLANVISDLDPSEQQALLARIAQLNFQKGFYELSEQYRARLSRQNQLTTPPEQVLTELRQIREQIAEHDYPA